MGKNRIFFRATKLNTWEPVEFEKIAKGDLIKMVELSPNKTEVMSEIWEIENGYNPKTGVFEGHLTAPAIYLPVSKGLLEMFKEADNE